jgi:hypothetical protein
VLEVASGILLTDLAERLRGGFEERTTKSPKRAVVTISLTPLLSLAL